MLNHVGLPLQLWPLSISAGRRVGMVARRLQIGLSRQCTLSDDDDERLRGDTSQRGVRAAVVSPGA